MITDSVVREYIEKLAGALNEYDEVGNATEWEDYCSEESEEVDGYARGYLACLYHFLEGQLTDDALLRVTETTKERKRHLEA